MAVLRKAIPGHMLGSESGVGTARYTAGCTARHVASEGDLRRYYIQLTSRIVK